jgi:RNA polymerase sigma factor (sigma-70 family)
MVPGTVPTPNRPAPADRPAPAGHADRADREERLAVLLEEARGGRRESLGEIVAELTPLLWHVVRAQGLDREMAEDVVQTTWLRLLDHLATIQTPRALTGWLVVVAKREAWHVSGASRAGRTLDEQVAANLPDADAAPDDQVIADERHRLLWTVVARLDDRCQRLLRVVAFAPSPSYAKVAAALGMPVGSIGPTRGRCLAKLRTLLTAEPAWSWR